MGLSQPCVRGHAAKGGSAGGGFLLHLRDVGRRVQQQLAVARECLEQARAQLLRVRLESLLPRQRQDLHEAAQRRLFARHVDGDPRRARRVGEDSEEEGELDAEAGGGGGLVDACRALATAARGGGCAC
eukprot:5331322-Prymnesium_polylepis.1